MTKPTSAKGTTRNADWSRDERILALDVYLRHKGRPPGGKGNPDVQALSALLRKTAAAHGVRISPTFRNDNGVYTKLMNFQQYDPEFISRGRRGMDHSARGDAEVWAEFGSEPALCHQTAETVRALFENEPAVLEPDSETEDDQASEGSVLTKAHRVRERSRALIQKKKRQVLKLFGRLICEVCGFDCSGFGVDPIRWYECHHVRPVHTLKPGDRTKLSDLAIICPNCHRLIHAFKPWLTLNQARVTVMPRSEAPTKNVST